MYRYFCIGVFLFGFAAVMPNHSAAQTSGAQFKRVKVGETPVGQRINIQIDPNAVAAAEAEAEDDASNAAPDYAIPSHLITEEAFWFWSEVSPALSSASTLSLQVAAGVNGPEAQTLDPELTYLTGLSEKYGKELLRFGAEMRVSPALLLAVMYVESGGRPDAVSPAGAEGVMQLIPATAKRFGVADAKNPEQAIEGAAKYMRFLLDEFGGDAVLALAGYNAGENAVLRHGGVPPYEETRYYVPKVVAAWRIARRLCRTRQDYPTDGCVFVNLG